MPFIELNTGASVEVDAEDWGYLSQWRWSESAARRGHPGYAMRGTTAGGVRRSFYLHREVAIRAGIISGHDDPSHIDHENRNKLDARRSNLRSSSVSENNGNVDPRSTSGLLGVYPSRSGWCAEVQRSGQRRRRYGFQTPESAAKWREVALADLRKAS